MDVREKLDKLLGKWLGHLSLAAANDLIANGVTIATDNNVGDQLSQTDKDINVPSKWISVNNRLPEDWCPVLVMVRDVGKPLLGSYRENAWFHEKWNTTFINGAVTHWMPLPQAPEGD